MKASARGLLSGAVFAALFGIAPSAKAAQERVHLRFQAAGDCPSEKAFRDEVLTRTRELEFDSERPTRELEISVGSAAFRAWGELRFYRPGEEGTSRRIEDDTCSGVVSALALIAALAVDPHASMADLTGALPREQTPAAPAAPPPHEPSALRDRPDADAVQLGLDAIVSGEARTAESPTVTGAVAIAVELTIKSALQPAVRLGGRLGASPRIERGPGEVQFRVAAISLELSLARLHLGSIEANAWAGMEYGAVTAEGLSNNGLAQQGQGSAPWIALLQTARFAADVGAGFKTEFELGLIEPLRRDRFFFDQPVTLVHAVPGVGILAGLGAGYHFF